MLHDSSSSREWSSLRLATREKRVQAEREHRRDTASDKGSAKLLAFVRTVARLVHSQRPLERCDFEFGGRFWRQPELQKHQQGTTARASEARTNRSRRGTRGRHKPRCGQRRHGRGSRSGDDGSVRRRGDRLRIRIAGSARLEPLTRGFSVRQRGRRGG